MNDGGCGKAVFCEFGDGREKRYNSAEVVSEM